MNAIKIALIASAVAFSSAALALPVKMTDAEMSQIVAGQPPAGSPAWKDIGTISDSGFVDLGGGVTQSTVQTCVSTGRNCTGIANIETTVTTVTTTTEAKSNNPNAKANENAFKNSIKTTSETTTSKTTLTSIGNLYRVK